MKEHGLEGATEAPGRALKSLLKKPGQTKAKGQKNRVVINEKLNEFFAADYIILIKEECCADYEEECDCCCQEHEMIRLGNCKECRAELNLHFAEEPHFVVDEVDIDDRTRVFHDDEADEEEEDDDDDDNEEEDDNDDEDEDEDEQEEEQDKRTSLRKLQQRQTHQRETLSPPEGYKDLCLANDLLDEDQPVCAECDYYQRVTEAESIEKNEDVKNVHDDTSRLTEDQSIQQTIDQAQQTTPDVHQRYLVETITMTTVTERRIVREISEEETTRNSSTDEIDHQSSNEIAQGEAAAPKDQSNQDAKAIEIVETECSDKVRANCALSETSEAAMTLKLAANSLKPNSAVRQLFPDQRFISPPSKGGGCISLDDESADAEAQKFLITTESLRLLDTAKRAARGTRSSRSDSCGESDSSSIKRTIERNALRRSLICKFDTASRKKNLRSKDLTLEERIRQLTCVDVDETVEHELPARTSPSGEEEQPSRSSDEARQPASTYRKITELFSPKKPLDLNLPDIGLGNNKVLLGRSVQHKINSDARKQFLASLAPLSCVASTASVDSRDDYYRISAKLPVRPNRNSSDDSYSLEDIDSALKTNQTNYNSSGAPPDVTRGTPTSHAPEDTDSIGDELLAFVEQDKSRTERIKRRYNDSSETNDQASAIEKKNKNNNNNNNNKEETAEDVENEDEEDDELNDYGFNKRPSVRGIKAQFSSTNDIVQQIRARTISNVFAEATEDAAGVENSIHRLNGTHKIDDIYQSLAETTLSMNSGQERAAYINSTLPRSLGHVQVGENCAIYTDQKNGMQYQEQAGRLLRIAGGNYATLPTKGRRHPAYANYHCNVFPAANGKCYRTMYLVPYDGLTDPTYQNLQRIIPAQSTTANYANHIERYPYPRNGRLDQQQPGYYVRQNAPQIVPSQQPQALHVHVHQSDEFHMTPGQTVAPSVHQIHPMHLQHHHQQQPLAYNVQPIPGYSVTTPYSYQVQLNRGTSDIQMQTITLPPTIGSNCSSQPMSTFTGTTQMLGTVTSSSVLSSPTKISQQKKESCTAAERGVPEGAVSAPAHDYTQNNLISGTFLPPSGNVPPPNTQNSVYYAMNV